MFQFWNIQVNEDELFWRLSNLVPEVIRVLRDTAIGALILLLNFLRGVVEVIGRLVGPGSDTNSVGNEGTEDEVGDPLSSYNVSPSLVKAPSVLRVCSLDSFYTQSKQRPLST